MKTAIVWLIPALVVSISLPTANGEPSKGIPEKARQALSFFVGEWESDALENGVKVGASTDRRTWAPGRVCLTLNALVSLDGSEFRAAGVAGWDAQAGAVIEYWYSSQGDSLIVRYPLEEMTENVWKGTARLASSDGTVRDGVCRLTKTSSGFEYMTQSTQDGKEIVRKSVARRVKSDKARDSARVRTQEPPASHPHLKALGDMMVGDWEGETVPWVDEAKDTEKAKKVFLRCSIRWTLGGAALEEKGTVGDGGFRGLEVWDGDSKQIKRFMVDLDGGVAEGTIVNRSGKWIFEESYVSADGKTRRSHTATMTIGPDGDTVTFVHDPVVIDGKPQKPYQDILRRVRR